MSPTASSTLAKHIRAQSHNCSYPMGAPEMSIYTRRNGYDISVACSWGSAENGRKQLAFPPSVSGFLTYSWAREKIPLLI